MIDSREISVVVQGAVAGRPTDPPSARLTERCLLSVRRRLPHAEIILSTWKGSQVEGLSFDRLVLNDDPGAHPLDAARKTPNNINRQIVSTHNGLAVAERKYAVKLRSDFEMFGTGFLDYFNRYRARCDSWRIFRERVVAPTVFSINPRRFAPMPFHPSDWFFFGLRDDLRNLWDVPAAPEPETSRWYEERTPPRLPFLGGRMARYAPEQTLWLGLLRKHAAVACDHMTDATPEAIELTELTFANNLVLASPRRLGIRNLKGSRGSDFDRDCFAIYTHRDWLKLYRRYCDRAVQVPMFEVRSSLNGQAFFWYSLYRRMHAVAGGLTRRSVSPKS